MTTDNFSFYLQSRLIQTKEEAYGTVILPPGLTVALINRVQGLGLAGTYTSSFCRGIDDKDEIY